jgi:hypothetical protein
MSEILYPPRIKALNYNRAFDYPETITSILNLSSNVTSSFVGGFCEFFVTKNFEVVSSLTTKFDNVLDVQLNASPILNQSYIYTAPEAPEPIIVNPGIKSLIKSDNVLHGPWIDGAHWPILVTLDAELNQSTTLLTERMIGLHANLNASPTLTSYVSTQKDEAGPESGLRSSVKPLVEAINFYSWMGTIPYTHLVEETINVSEYLRDLTLKLNETYIEGALIYATPTVECFFEIQNRFHETINVSESVDAEFDICMEHTINVFPTDYANVVYGGALVITPFEDRAVGIKTPFKPIVEAINFDIPYITIPDSWKIEATLNMPARVSVKLDDTFYEFVTLNETLTVFSNFGRYVDQTFNVSETLYSELDMTIESQLNQSMSLESGVWSPLLVEETTLPYKIIVPSVNYDRAWIGDTPHAYTVSITKNESMIMRLWYKRDHYINGGIVIIE